MSLFRKCVLLTLSLLFAACSTPLQQPASPAPSQALFKGNTVDEADVIDRSEREGCQLIPYASKRQTCVDRNEGLHDPDACGATACERAAGQAANRLRLMAWQNCVDRRTSINGAFNSTLKDLESFKGGPEYKNWGRKGKNAMAKLIGKIEAGKLGHKEALENATTALNNCKKIVK